MLPNYNPSPLTRSRQAFTLLEILIAITIFSVCLTALYNTFHVSSTAFQKGRIASENMQSLRFVMNQLAKDLRGVYYKPNVNQQFQQIAVQIVQQQDAVLDALESGGDLPIAALQNTDDSEGAATPFVGLKANLRFVGRSGGNTSNLAFTHYLPSDGTVDNAYLGAERVRYFVHEGSLYRQRSRVFQPMRLNPDLEEELVNMREEQERLREEAMETGNNALVTDYRNLQLTGHTPPPGLGIELPEIEFFVPEPQPPLPAELIARDVAAFEVKFGYYKSGDWQETSSWDSDSKAHRTPEFNVPLNDPYFRQKLIAYSRMEQDHLPSYVRLKIEVQPTLRRRKGKDEKGKPEAIETLIWIPASQETFNPDMMQYFQPTPLDSQGNPLVPVNFGSM